jgi:uncharacterized membrane protein
MAKLRSFRERLVQAAIYEAVGLAIVTPVYGYAMDVTVTNSLVTMAAISIAVMVWSSIYNSLYDRAYLHLTGRAAHERNTLERIVHALILEATITVFAVPIICIMSGASRWTAFMADIAFTMGYAVYTYIFHLIYDRVRPVRDCAG